MTATRAVLFDVDFTLIYPGPTFRGEGYQAFCARHGMGVDPSMFEEGVACAAGFDELLSRSPIEKLLPEHAPSALASSMPANRAIHPGK